LAFQSVLQLPLNLQFHKPFFFRFLLFFYFYFFGFGPHVGPLFGPLFTSFLEIYPKIEKLNTPEVFFTVFFIIFFFLKSVFFRFFLSQFSFRFFPVEVCRSNWRKNKLETKLKKLKTKPNIKLKKTHKISNQTKNNWKPNSRSNWKKHTKFQTKLKTTENQTQDRTEKNWKFINQDLQSLASKESHKLYPYIRSLTYFRVANTESNWMLKTCLDSFRHSVSVMNLNFLKWQIPMSHSCLQLHQGRTVSWRLGGTSWEWMHQVGHWARRCIDQTFSDASLIIGLYRDIWWCILRHVYYVILWILLDFEWLAWKWKPWVHRSHRRAKVLSPGLKCLSCKALRCSRSSSQKGAEETSTSRF
jgi:hypothetical protein